MTKRILTSNTATKQFLNSGDSLTIVAGVDLSVADDTAIYGMNGAMSVNVVGNVYGDIDGIYDSTSNGGDSIIVAASGSIVAYNDDIVSSGFSNTLTNAGALAGNIGVMFGPQSTIENSGSVSGLQTAIVMGAGAYLTNSGSVTLSSRQDDDVLFQGSGNFLSNTGTVSGGLCAVHINGTSNTILNSGVIAGSDFGVFAVGTTNGSSVVNSGTISGGGIGLYLDDHTESIDNLGTIQGEATGVLVDASSASLTNTGTISGLSNGVTFAGGDDTLVNSGHILGDVVFGGGDNVYDGTLGSVSGVIFLGSGSNTVTGGAGVEKFIADGAFAIDAGAGNDVLNAGDDMTSAQHFDGGDGDDTLILSGASYAAGLVFAPSTLVNVERLQLSAGDSYALTTDDATVAAGQRLTVNANALGASDALSLNASAETDGYYTIFGGSGADAFTFDAAHFSKHDVIEGGSGSAIDTLRFSTAGVLAAAQLANVSGVEKIALANGTNSITLSDALVASANAGLLSVYGGSGDDTINAAGVAAPHRVQFYGAGGADVMTAGAGNDQFLYVAATDSSGPTYDTIVGLNFTSDKLNLPGTNPITGVDTAVTSGALSTATFNADLTAALSGKLGAHHAVEFTASSGTLSGQTFLIADLNGTAGYQANADIVIHLAGATGTLAATSFI